MMTSENATEAERLEALHDLLTEIASGIRSAQEGLIASGNTSSTLELVVGFLGRLGWLADHGCVVAGDEFPPVVGTAHAWLMSPVEMDDLGKLSPSTKCLRVEGRESPLLARARRPG